MSKLPTISNSSALLLAKASTSISATLYVLASESRRSRTGIPMAIARLSPKNSILVQIETPVGLHLLDGRCIRCALAAVPPGPTSCPASFPTRAVHIAPNEGKTPYSTLQYGYSPFINGMRHLSGNNLVKVIVRALDGVRGRVLSWPGRAKSVHHRRILVVFWSERWGTAG